MAAEVEVVDGEELMAKARKRKVRMKPHGRRDANPLNQHNWGLTCGLCGRQYRNDQTLELMDHWGADHTEEEQDANPDAMALFMVWIGKGPAPTNPFYSKKPPARRTDA